MLKLVAYLIALTDAGQTFADPKDWPRYETATEAAQAWLERPNAPIRVLREDGSVDFGLPSEMQPVWDELKELKRLGRDVLLYTFVAYNEYDRVHEELAKHVGFPLDDVPELHFLARLHGGILKYTGNYTFRAKDGWFVHDGRASATIPHRAQTRDTALVLILKLRSEGPEGERCASPADRE